MSRYIDADAIKDKAWKAESEACFYALEDVVSVTDIDEAPSIDLIRCAECRKVREDGGHANCNGYLYCRKWKTLVDEDGYCSWGERRGE